MTPHAVVFKCFVAFSVLDCVTSGRRNRRDDYDKSSEQSAGNVSSPLSTRIMIMALRLASYCYLCTVR